MLQNILSYMYFTNIITTIIFGIPTSINIMLVTHFIGNIFIGKIIYFYILCRYLRLKLKNLNENVLQMKRGIRFIRIQNILNEFNEIYLEINEYNTTYWSKFLLIIWFTYGLPIIIYINAAITITLPLIFKITVIYII